LNAFSVEFPFCVVPAGGEGVGECYTLAERYGEPIHCFTLTYEKVVDDKQYSLFAQSINEKKDYYMDTRAQSYKTFISTKC
jgi:hypothetical protein